MGLPESFDYENSIMHEVLDFKGTEVYIADSMGEKHSGPVEMRAHAREWYGKNRRE